jgi:hypothetical protein
MAKETKTKPTEITVESFLNAVDDEKKRKDGFALLDIMKEATGFEAKMWGPSIVGYGSYHYKYASGHEGDACIVGFSPRKAAISLYLPGAVQEGTHINDLGKYKASKGCIYVKKLEDINVDVLKKLITESIVHNRKTYPQNQ